MDENSCENQNVNVMCAEFKLHINSDVPVMVVQQVLWQKEC